MIDERKVLAAIQEGIRDGLVETQLVLARVVRGMLSKPGTGRIYRIGKGRPNGRNLRAKGLHRASAPGQPPAVNTNRLRASWSVSSSGRNLGLTRISALASDEGFILPRIRSNSIGFEFGSNVPYAKYLEFGTSRVRRRPYLKPSMRAVEPRVLPIVTNALNRKLRSAR